MAENGSTIVAIELGTSVISGIAGKKKDGNLQILAYAEEPSTNCVKRGIVYNIEKTTQNIKTVIAKLQESLKLSISQVYVGIGGQSVRSVKSKVRRNMLTQTYITADHIDSMQAESCNVTIPDCELLDNFQQGFIIDSSQVDDPVGVVGTNIEGDYINVIARRRLKGNIETCFNSTNVRIADTKLSAYELAENVLTDQEKRAGSVLVDLGAGTTTVVVYKNNILRFLVTLPIGMANITQDLTSLQIDEKEAEQLKLKYGNAYLDDTEENMPQTYTTSYDRTVKLSEIQHLIYARLKEILVNVENQIANSGYGNQLLGGIVLTGGGSKMKNIEKAFAHLDLNIDKIRVARSINVPVLKNSSVSKLSLDTGQGLSVISLLMSGDENCVGENYNGPDIFDDKKAAQEAAERKAAEDAKEKADNEMSSRLEGYKNAIRQKITDLDALSLSVEKDGSDKKIRKHAEDVATGALAILDEEYRKILDELEGKDKFKQTLHETSELVDKLKSSTDQLAGLVAKAKKDNSFLSKLRDALNDMVND